MCNSTLFNYAQANLGGTHQLFGAMIRPASAEVANEIAEKLGQAQFACKFRPPKEGEEAEEEAAGHIDIYMNPAFKALIERLGHPLVPLVQCASVYDMVMSQYDWMIHGQGEGLVIVSPESGPNCNLCKWKIGLESGGGGRFADELVAALEAARK